MREAVASYAALDGLRVYPEQGGDQDDRGSVVAGEFVVAGGDAAPFLVVADAAFDHVVAFVEVRGRRLVGVRRASRARRLPVARPCPLLLEPGHRVLETGPWLHQGHHGRCLLPATSLTDTHC